MRNRLVIKALKHIIFAAASDELDILLNDLVGNYYYKEWFLSKEGDDEWEYYQSELEEGEKPKTRKKWAHDEEAYYRDFIGYPTFFYSNVTQVPDGTWLAHFTDKNPEDIIKQSFSGRDFSVLGLTTNWKEGTNEGPYAFAYEADHIGGTGYRDRFGKYGDNLILFKAKEAVKAYHIGDEEYQVIFIVDTAYDFNPVWGSSDGLTTYKDDNEFECERNQDCVHKIIDFLE